MAARKAQSRKSIEESLIKQLEVKGANAAHFYDQINDYLQLYDVKKKLIKDIKTRGVSYETMSASGNKIIKQNQSVKDLIATNKQMLNILDKLGLTTDKPTGGESVNDDL